MRILYALQGTGNGHISRAREFVPLFARYGQIDVLVSGTHSEIGLEHPILYRFHGMGFQFGKSGGVAVGQTIRQLRPLRFIKDLYALPIKAYDLILNDFEPVSAYAAKRAGQKVHAISHQAAFLSPKSPRPAHTNAPFAEWLFRHYAPSNTQTAFHFKAYDDFIHPPIIREEIRKLAPVSRDHISVYLPAYDEAHLIRHFHKLPEIQWDLFSKHTSRVIEDKNVSIKPVNNQQFLDSLATSQGLLTGGGFESPAEALYLGKKLFVVPMHNQYEQQCNAAALADMGIPVVAKIEHGFDAQLRNWLRQEQTIKLDFPNISHALVQGIVNL